MLDLPVRVPSLLAQYNGVGKTAPVRVFLRSQGNGVRMYV